MSKTADRATSKNLSSLRALWPFLLPYSGLMLAALIALVLTASISLVFPLAVRRVIDTFNVEQVGLLDQYFGAAIAISALLALGTAVRYSLVTRLGERVVTDIRKAVFGRVIGMGPSFYETILTGEVLSRITTDTTLILSVIGSSVSIALRNLLIFVGGLGMMLLTSAKLTGLVLLIVPAVIVPILTLGRRLRKLSKENQDWIANSSGNASEYLGAVQTVQAFTHEALTRKSFDDVSEKSFVGASSDYRTRMDDGHRDLLVFTGVVGVLWIGANDVRTDQMTAGTLVQFLIYSIMVAGGVAALSEIWGELQRAAGATERLVELLSIEDTVQDPTAPQTLSTPVSGAITFDAVTFHYPQRPNTVALDDVAFQVAAGKPWRLLGPRAGKSTIMQMLLRFYDPEVGGITIDGVNLRDMARHDFRQHIALVPQDAAIFAVSAMENIRFGRPEASDADVIAAAKAAAAHDFISALPDGYDTYVGERGVMLSGVKNNASRLRGRSCGMHPFYCWMKQQAPWTQKANVWFRRLLKIYRRIARPWSLRTVWQRSKRRIAFWSWIRAKSSPKAHTTA